jgi:leader peptidase (prepilin peptidase)/N-methyltransferase
MFLAGAVISYVTVLCLLAALAVYDFRHYILPDVLNAALATAFIIFHAFTHWSMLPPLSALLGAAVGGGLLLLIRTAANRFYKEDSLGLGDVKLMAAGGAGLGFPDILLALSLGAGLGLVHGLAMGWMEKRKGAAVDFGRVNVPAGVGLAAGIAMVMTMRFSTVWMQ